MARDYSYAALAGRPTLAAPGVPTTMAATPEGAAANAATTPTTGRAMFDFKGSPAVWYVLMVVAAMALAAGSGLVRGARD